MKGKSLCEQIVTDASHLHCKASEISSSVSEGTSKEGNWVVSLCHNKHSYEPLISIDNEIATKLGHVFLSSDHVLLRKTVKVTIGTSHHYWNVSQAKSEFLLRLGVDLSGNCSVQRCCIGERSQSALTG